MLNKLTPTSFLQLAKEFRELDLDADRRRCGTAVDLIFEKARREPLYAKLYAKLCKDRIEHDALTLSGTESFRRALCGRCDEALKGEGMILALLVIGCFRHSAGNISSSLATCWSSATNYA